MPHVTPKDWSPPDYLNLTERKFLVDRAETINGVIARSYLQVGQILLQVKRRFKRDPELDGWFDRWIEECLPFSRTKARTLALIAEAAEEDSELLSLTDSQSADKLYRLLCLPGKTRSELLTLLQNGEEVSNAKIQEFGKQPEVILEAAQEKAEEIQMKLLELELSIPSLSGAREYNAKAQRRGEQGRLKKALTQLQEAKDKVDDLEATRNTNEILVDLMRKKVKSQELYIENLTLDPIHKRKRALAQTVVDATKGLDLLLSSLDRYSTDKSDIGPEAIETIEKKMEQVKQRLSEYYATRS